MVRLNVVTACSERSTPTKSQTIRAIVGMATAMIGVPRRQVLPLLIAIGNMKG